MDVADEASFDDNIIAHYDWMITALDVDYHGKYAALASKKWIALVDLERAKEAGGRRKLMRESKWETHTLRWNPHASDSDVLLASLNFKIEVWRTGGSDAGKRQLLRAHTLRVSDLCWSPTDPNLFASCSMDAFVYIWDLRDARKPCTAMKTIAGSSQVKWNSFNDNVLASAHDMDVRLWDRRKPQIASQYISAHLKQIHGMDWCPTVAHKLSTCSHDGRVQVWNTEQARISQPEITLNIGAPVWRAKFTPFGYGLVTTLRSQLHGVTDHGVQLWNLADTSTPVHSYSGHSDTVLDFVWQNKADGGDRKAYTMVSASKDQTMRSWHIDEQSRRACTPGDRAHMNSGGGNVGSGGGGGGGGGGASASLSGGSLSLSGQHPPLQSAGSFHDTELPHDDSLNASRVVSGHELGAFSQDVPLSALPSTELGVSLLAPPVFSQPHTLSHEFALLNLQIEGLHVEKLDAVQRICVASVTGASLYAQLTISFPALYPNEATPSFHFSNSSTIDNTGKSHLISVLMTTAKSHVSLNRPCLEPCLRELVVQMRSGLRLLNSVTRVQTRTSGAVVTSYGNSLDDHVPFPRTSGARFCGNGYLVIFKRPETLKAPPNSTTPQSLAELALICNSYRRPGPGLLHSRTASISGYYRLNPDSGPSLVKPIAIFETALLLKLHKSLAISARLSEDVTGMCLHNGNAALVEGRDDLHRAWQLMQSLTEQQMHADAALAMSRELTMPWAYHPFGRHLATSLICHYSSSNDIQAVALLACACFSSAKHSQAMMPLLPSAHSTSMSSGRHPSSFSLPSGGTSTSHYVGSPSFHTSSSGSQAGYSPGHHGQSRISSALASFQQSMSLALPESFMTKASLASSPTLTRSCSLTGELLSPGYGEHSAEDEHFFRTSLLDCETLDRCLQCCWWYAEVLHRWELFEQRAELLHCVGAISTQDPNNRLVTKTLCSSCNTLSSSLRCDNCRKINYKCAICHIPVKGLSNFCLSCGHGGHWDHMASWFETSKVCPSGCGCVCFS